MRCGARRPLIDDMQHRIETIQHIQVTFPLLAVSQHLQIIRMFDQLFVEIDNVSVSVPCAQDRDETKDVSFELKAFAVSLN